MSQAGIEHIENSSVSGLDFSIRLRMYDEGESMLDVELVQELFEPPTIELSVIIRDDPPEETILAYYGLPDEWFSLKFDDVGHGLGLYPFGEIV